MANEKPAPWIGASGAEYVFYVFGLEPDVPKRPGNYIYAKRNEQGAWVPIYMGHGDVSSCCTDPDLRRCIETKAATHVHLRLNSLAADREAELQDLLAHYANAFAPEGCHLATASNVRAPPRPRKAPDTTTVAKTTSAKKRLAKKTPAKKTPAKKTPAKKSSAKKSSAKKAAPRKSVTTKTPTKATARKAAVKAKPKRPRPSSR